MLFFNHYKFREGKRDEIIEQRVAQGHGAPEGTKVLGQWTRLDGSGGMMLFETDKPDYTWTMMWSQLLDMEIVPVLDTEKDVMGLLK